MCTWPSTVAALQDTMYMLVLILPHEETIKLIITDLWAFIKSKHDQFMNLQSLTNLPVLSLFGTRSLFIKSLWFLLRRAISVATPT